MTTQVEITNSNQAVQAQLRTNKKIWLLGLAVLLILSILSAAMLVMQVRGEDLSGNRRALEAGWSAAAARNQGLADDFAAHQVAQLERSWSASGERYQAMADAFLAKGDVGIEAGWAAAAARYQGLADDFAARQRTRLERGWSASAQRYQGMAND